MLGFILDSGLSSAFTFPHLPPELPWVQEMGVERGWEVVDAGRWDISRVTGTRTTENRCSPSCGPEGIKMRLCSAANLLTSTLEEELLHSSKQVFRPALEPLSVFQLTIMEMILS